MIRRVLAASIVIDPVHRANAQEISEMMPEAWETIEAFSDDGLETVKVMEANEIIEDISGDEEGTVLLPSNDGQSGSGVCDAGEEIE